jgi:hypothetical protein
MSRVRERKPPPGGAGRRFQSHNAICCHADRAFACKELRAVDVYVNSRPPKRLVTAPLSRDMVKLRGSSTHPADSQFQLKFELFGSGRPQSIVNVGRTCRSCGAESFLTGPGKGPHVASLTCVTCGRHGGWLSRTEAETQLRRAAL